MAPVRIAILSADRRLSERLLGVARAQASLAVVGRDERAALGPSLRAARPDVLLVDSRLEGALGLCALLRDEGGPAVIFTAVRDEDDWVRRALEAGARGILARSVQAGDVVKAIRIVHEGRIWVRRRVLEECLERLTSASIARLAGEAVLELWLSRREREVFRQAATGLSNKEVADRLAISQATVKTHLSRIFQKLGLRRRSELVAAHHGLIHIAPALTSPRSPRRRT